MLFLIGLVTTMILVFFIMGVAGSGIGILALPFVIIAIVLGVALVISGISLSVRRLHDMNLSGLWYLGIIAVSFLSGGFEQAYGNMSPVVLLLNVINLIIGLILLFYPGTRGYNRFGADPLMRDSEYVDSIFGDGPDPGQEPHRPYDPQYGSYLKKTPQKHLDMTNRRNGDR